MKYSVIFTTFITLALSSQPVSAGSIGDTYETGGILTKANMDNIKAAVNDNDVRINTNATNTGINTTDIATIQTTTTNNKFNSRITYRAPVLVHTAGNTHVQVLLRNTSATTCNAFVDETSNGQKIGENTFNVLIFIPSPSALSLPQTTRINFTSTTSTIVAATNMNFDASAFTYVNLSLSRDETNAFRHM